MLTCCKLLFHYRKILYYTTINDIRSRYKGTVLGLFWTILYPLLFLSLYSVVYLFVFKIRLPELSQTDYVLLIFCGLVPFLGFAEALGSGVGVVQANAGLIKNTMFPIELLPVKTVFTASVSMLVGLCLLLCSLWIKGIFHYTQAFVPLIFLLQILFSIGVVWLLSALNVFIQDLGQMVGVVVLFLMLISPIAYTNDMVPEGMMPFMYPNPLYYLINLYRQTMMYGEIPYHLFAIFVPVAIIFFFSGYYCFSRLKPIFADHV